MSNQLKEKLLQSGVKGRSGRYKLGSGARPYQDDRFKNSPLRKSKGITQDDLASRLSVSRQTISKWENGSALPDAYNLKEIARVFEVSVDELLDDEREVTPKNEDGFDRLIKLLKKHWLKVGYLIAVIGLIEFTQGVTAKAMIDDMASIFGMMFPMLGDDTMSSIYEGTIGQLYTMINRGPDQFLIVGAILIVIGIIFIVLDFRKMRKRKEG